MSLDIQIETTPNPASRKFIVGKPLATSTQWFADAAAAADNPIASAIFALGGIGNVMLLNDFVSVGKTDEASWDELEAKIIEVLQANVA